MDENKTFIYSWGYGKYGQIGTLDYHYVAEPIEIINKFQSISNIYSGEFHNIISTEDDKIYSFGKNTFGQLGLGHDNISVIPVQINFSMKIKKI